MRKTTVTCDQCKKEIGEEEKLKTTHYLKLQMDMIPDAQDTDMWKILAYTPCKMIPIHFCNWNCLKDYISKNMKE